MDETQARQPELPRLAGARPIEALLFDAGLTLLHNITSAAEMAAVILGREAIRPGRDALNRAMRLTDLHLERTWRHGDWWASEAQVRQLFVEGYQVGLGTLPELEGRPARTRAIARAMYEAYADAAHWALYPDVLPTLDRLKGAGIVMGVVSDWGHGLEALLLDLGLADAFAFVVVSSRLGVAKPDPSVFRMALERIAVAPQHALYVGDTYVKDVLGARAAGLTPVLLDRSHSAPPSDCRVIHGLDGLLPLVGLGSGGSGSRPD